MANPEPEPRTSRLGAAGWIALFVLFCLLGWAGWYAVHVWSELSGVAMSPLGWLFMILGVLVTFLVGAGLMALVFYSNRHHYDR